LNHCFFFSAPQLKPYSLGGIVVKEATMRSGILGIVP